jgi:hypothetical protein
VSDKDEVVYLIELQHMGYKKLSSTFSTLKMRTSQKDTSKKMNRTIIKDKDNKRNRYRYNRKNM